MTKLIQSAWLVGLAGASLLAGCRQDMHNQPKFVPQRGTDFYADGRSARPQVPNTVARGQLREDSYFYTGLVDGKEGDALPVKVSAELLERGQERYNIYCTPCHSRIGNGAGMIVQRGYAPAGNLLGSRLRAAGLGHFFNVMTNGYGAMPDYAAQLTPADRWAVSAYIRALQLSQNAQRSDAPSGVEVKELRNLAESLGLSDSFAAEWTAVQAAPVLNPPTPTPAAPQSAATTAASAASPDATPPKVKKESSAASIQAGEELYTANCQVCHKADRAGKAPMFPSLVGIVSRTSVAHVKTTVHNGQPPMRAFPELSPDDLDHLVAYLASPVKTAVATPPAAKPDEQ